MKLLFLLVMLALSGYASAAKQKKVTLYNALRPVLKKTAKKRVKNLVKDDRLVWGDGITSKQKAGVLDLLKGSRASGQGACPPEPVCIGGTQKVAIPFLARLLIITRSTRSPCSPCSPFMLQCTRIRALHPRHALLHPLPGKIWP